MAKRKKNTSISTDDLMNNNIELAKELNRRKQKITELSIELQDVRYSLLDTSRRLSVADAKNYTMEIEMKALIRHSEQIQVELNERDQQLMDWTKLFIGTLNQTTAKYFCVMNAIGATTSEKEANLTKASSNEEVDEMSCENDAMPVSTISIVHDDDRDVEMDASPTPPMTLYPNVVVIKKYDQEEFSIDSNMTDTSSMLDKSSDMSLNFIVEKPPNVDEPKDIAVSVPTIAITMYDDPNASHQALKTTKRASNISDGLLHVPKRSFGIRKSEPKTAFNSKSPPTCDQRHSFKRTSTSLNKIIETSLVAKSSEISSFTSTNQSNSPTHDEHQSSQPLLSSINNNDLSIDVNFPKSPSSLKSLKPTSSPLSSPNPLITPTSSPFSSPNFTDRNNELKEPAVRKHTPKRIFNKKSNDSNKKNNELSNRQASPTPSYSTKDQSNDLNCNMAAPNVANTTNVDQNDCIAKHRTSRRAAPKDLRDPISFFKKQRKF